jgi:hypothetical protein
MTITDVKLTAFTSKVADLPTYPLLARDFPPRS